MREHTPSSKFQFRNRGELMHPGSCMSCGSGTREEGYIDLSTYYDYEGQMYLCFTCMVEAAEVVGCLSPDESKHLLRISEDFATKIEQLKEELTNANQRLRAYDAILDTVRSDFVTNESVGLEVTTAEPTLFDDADELNDDTNAGSVNGESESTESVESGSGLTGSDRFELSDESTRVSTGISI